MNHGVFLAGSTEPCDPWGLNRNQIQEAVDALLKEEQSSEKNVRLCLVLEA